jgi:hypothetical protein
VNVYYAKKSLAKLIDSEVKVLDYGAMILGHINENSNIKIHVALLSF